MRTERVKIPTNWTRMFIPPSQTEASHIFRIMSKSTPFSGTADIQHNHYIVTQLWTTERWGIWAIERPKWKREWRKYT